MYSSDDRRSTVLLVEDDEMLSRLLSARLRRAGYKVVAVADGEEGLAFLRNAAASIYLLVTDIQMPRMSGIELAEAAGGSGCPVFLISGTPLPDEAAGRGWAFLAKPFALETFLRMVKEILDRTATPQAADAGRPRLILAEDDAEVRRRLCGLLNQEYEIVAALDEGGGVLAKAQELQPEVILLDIGMPGMNGFAVARVLRQSMPWVPLLFVTQHNEPAYVEEAFACGVAGYVLKKDAVCDLSSALRRVRSGRRYLSPGLRAR